MQVSRKRESSPLLEGVDLHVSAQGSRILRGVSVSVAEKEVICVIGPSGSGKTTLLRCLALQQEFLGEVRYRGEVVAAGARVRGRQRFETRGDARTHRRRVGLVFQEFNLWEEKSVLQNLIEAPRYHGEPRTSALSRAGQLLASLGLGGLGDRMPAQLSGGQRQRVALARALMVDPELLLLDEVTSALDPESVGELLKSLQMIAKSGVPMVIVTHHLDFARAVATRIVMMDEGAIVEEGAPFEILDAPQTDRTRQFLGRLLWSH